MDKRMLLAAMAGMGGAAFAGPSVTMGLPRARYAATFWDSQRKGTYVREGKKREQYSGEMDPALVKDRARLHRKRLARSKRGWLPFAKR